MDRRSFEHLCQLARLELKAEELVEFERKFNKLLGFVEQVKAFEPPEGAKPLTLVDELDLRRDNARGFEWPEGHKHDYRVPQIIDFEGGG